MNELPVEIEIQRVMNLVRGFGWEKVKEEIMGDTIKITLEKKVTLTSLQEGQEVPS